MENNVIKQSCCFFGHRKINETVKLKEKLVETIEFLINEKDVTVFYFGSKSDFDSLCLDVVTCLKEKYPHVKRVYVRSSYQHIDESYKNYLLESYEETYYPEHIKDSGKASYVERNQEMINKSGFCVVYYDKDYQPPKRKISKKDVKEYQPKSGTALAYDYAVKKKREIINVLNTEENGN